MSLGRRINRLGLGLLAAVAGLSCHAASTAGTGPDTTVTDTTKHTPPPPPADSGRALVVAGNISQCGTTGDVATALLVDSLPGEVMTLGDAAFPFGTTANYHQCFDPQWGRFLPRLHAVLGNHDYDSSSAAAGAFAYFGTRAGTAGKGYYSFDLGAWHVIVLNDNIPYAAGSPQDAWLRADLAANHAYCTMAVWHQPLFLSNSYPGFTVRPTRRPLWNVLDSAGVDLVVNGHEHDYERFAPMKPDGTRDDSTGIREFNVGTGGSSLENPDSAFHPNSQVEARVFGVLSLRLRDSSYTWRFVPVAGQTFADTGTTRCH